MSDGGLLQKAMEQQSSDTELVAEAVVAPPKGGPMFSNSLKLGLALALVSVVSMWIFSSPSIQSDWSFVILLPIMMGGASFWFIWNGIGRKHTEVISVVLILLLASPFLAMSVSSSSLTITDSTLSSDATTITLTIRESGGLFGSASGDADVSVSYGGEEVWTTSMPFAVNLKDGYGDYGQLVLPIVSFYSDNAADDAKYIVSIDVDGASDTYILNSAHLERTVEQVKNEALAAIGEGNDCDGGHDNCVIGVGLRTWVGLPRMSQPNDPDPRPAPLVHADFEMSAVLSKDGVTAIEYPTVTVTNGEAIWDSNSGVYGSGSAEVGDFGSELSLPGSVDDFVIGMPYIPRDDWQENDYGCYEFTVTLYQSPPWGDQTAHTASKYYELVEEGGDEDGSPDTHESWNEVSSC